MLSVRIEPLVSFLQQLHDDFVVTERNRTDVENIVDVHFYTQTDTGFFIVFLKSCFIRLHMHLRNEEVFYFREGEVVFINDDPRFLCSVTKGKHTVHMNKVLDVDGCHCVDDYGCKVIPELVGGNQYW